MRILNWFIVFFTIFIAACSQMPMKSKSDIKVFTFEPKKDLGLGSGELADMVQLALKVGGKAPEYLATDLFLKGNDASMRGDFQTSVRIFRHVLELDPKDYYIQKKLAYELIRNGELKEAEKYLAQAYFTDGKKDETTGLILGNVYASLEKSKEAKNIYQNVLSRNPASEEACLYLGKMYVAEKLYKDVHALMNACQKRNPENPSFTFFLGRVEYERGLKKNAEKFFQKTLKIDPTYSQAALAIGALAEEKDDYKSAMKIYQSFLKNEENAENIPVLSRMVNVLFTLEKDEEVLPFAETLVALDSNDLNLKVRLGLLYSDLERFDDASKLFKEVLSVVPDSDKVLYYLGALNQQTNKLNDSMDYYKKIPNSSPLFGDASIQIGQQLSAMAREEMVLGKEEGSQKFISFIENRLKENPEYIVELKMLETSFYEDLFQYKKAIESLSVAKDHKKFTESHKYYLAALFEKDGQYNEARQIVKNIIDKDPNNAHALNFLGYSYLERNEKLDTAYEYISKAVALKPDDGYIRDSLAWYFFQTGKFQEALVHAKKAIELVKDDVTITKHLGMIYQRLRYYDKAKVYLTEALKNAQAESEREDVLKILKDVEGRLPAAIP